jgi:hypothetical protein
MARTKKTDIVTTVGTQVATNPTSPTVATPIAIDYEMDRILSSIATTAYNDYNRIGDAISNQIPLDDRCEQVKMQHGSLAVKAILARTALAYSRRY